MKISKNQLLRNMALLSILCAPCNLLSQQVDTLYYFNPDCLMDCGWWEGPTTGEITDLATYFIAPVGWNHYDLIEFQMLATNDTGIAEIWFSIYSGESDIEQSTLIEMIEFILHDSTDRYPNWKTVDLTGYDSLNGLSGNFWIRSGVLAAALCDTSPPSGHTISYTWIIGYEWRIIRDYAIRAIVKKNDTIGIEQSNGANELLPTDFDIHQAYPNPFNPVTTINYALHEAANVTMVIHDILGREVVRLVNQEMQPGYHTVVWDARDDAGRAMPTGIYIARLITPEHTKSIKMLLLK